MPASRSTCIEDVGKTNPYKDKSYDNISKQKVNNNNFLAKKRKSITNVRMTAVKVRYSLAV